MLKILSSVFLGLWSCLLMAHPSAIEHYADVRMVLDGFGNNKLEELHKATSSAMDAMGEHFNTHFNLNKKFTPKTHRLLGHSWPLDGAIPKDVLKTLECEYGVSRIEIGKWWSTYRKNVLTVAQEITGLPPKQAEAFAGIIWEVHHLGDRVPGNVLVDAVMGVDDIEKNLERYIDILLKNHPQDEAEVKGALRRVLQIAKKTKMSDASTSQALMDELKRSKLGTRIYKNWKNYMKLTWNEVKAARIAEKVGTQIKTLEEGRVTDVVENAAGRGTKTIVGEARNDLVSSFEKQVGRVREVSYQGKKIKAIDIPIVRHEGRFYPLRTFAKQQPNTFEVLKDSARVGMGMVASKGTKKAGEDVVMQGAVKGGTNISKWLKSPAGAGTSAGVITFMVLEGQAILEYKDGKLADDEFLRKSLVNSGVAVTEGVAVVYLTAALGTGVLATGGIVIACIAIEKTGEWVWWYVDKEYGVLPGIDLNELLWEAPKWMKESKTVFDADNLHRLENVEHQKRLENVLFSDTNQRPIRLDPDIKDNPTDTTPWKKKREEF